MVVAGNLLFFLALTLTVELLDDSVSGDVASLHESLSLLLHAVKRKDFNRDHLVVDEGVQ